ncbi:MAG TPA: hypothetical protein VF251_05915 [Pyrinomonadaceae bacterium]
MSNTKIRGNTQIMDDTITNAQIKSDAAIDLSKLAEPVIQADGGQSFTADQSMGGNKLTNLDDGTNPGDAINLSQLEAAVAAIASGSAKNVVRLATTANIVLSGTQTIDGVAGSADDRVLVKNQTAPEENGIYLMKSGAWVRTTDADSWTELVGAIVPVAEGTANHDTVWLITADQGGVLGTTAVTTVQLPGPSDILAGAGMTRTGQTLDVVAADTSLTVGANNVAVNPGDGIEISSGVRVKLDGSTLARSGSGMKVADAGITGTQLAASVAGDGLSGGAGSALSVNTDDSTIEKSSDALRVKDAGITSAKLGTGARRIVRETPSGSVNGSNDTFTLANTPASGKEEVFLNGLLQEPGGEDYTITTNSIVFVSAPLTGDRIRVNYMF